MKQKLYKLSLLFLFTIFLSSCGGGGGGSTSPTTSSAISGNAQKGPFAKDSTVTIYKLNDKGVRTGNSATTKVTDDLGSYSFQDLPWGGASEIVADGNYFNEDNGSNSIGSVTAVVDLVKDSTSAANINVLTNMARERIKQKMSGGDGFAKARIAGENAVKKLFNIKTTKNLTTLDISDGTGDDKNDNAELLKVSTAISEDYSLLGKITDSLKDGDVSSDETGVDAFEELSGKMRKVKLGDIAEKLKNKFKEAFEKPPTEVSNHPPVITSKQTITIPTDASLATYTLTATDEDNDTVTWTVNSNPLRADVSVDGNILKIKPLKSFFDSFYNDFFVFVKASDGKSADTGKIRVVRKQAGDLTLKAINNENKTYGDPDFRITLDITNPNKHNLTYSASSSNTKIADVAIIKPFKLPLLGTITPAKIEITNKNVGTATITVSISDGINTDTKTMTLNVGKKGAKIIINPDQKKIYSKSAGTNPSEYTYKIVGLINNDTLGVVSTTREVGENIGTYTISATTPNNSNYNITLQTNTFTILPKPITITADAKRKDKEDSDPTLTYSVKPALITGDTLTGKLTRDSGEDDGSYQIKQGTLNNSNYSITYISALFYIGKEIQTKKDQDNINLQNITKKQGDGDFTPTFTGGNGSGKLVLTNSSNINIATIVDNKIHIITPGTTTITAYKAGDTTYKDSNTTTFVLTINEKPKEMPLLVVRMEWSDIKFTDNESTWASKIFGTNNGQLNNYFKEVSNSKFQFIPANETNGTTNDGVATTKLNMNHPGNSNEAFLAHIKTALRQIDEDIDFKAYDANNNGAISRNELQIMFLVAGGETAVGGTNPGKSIWAHAWCLQKLPYTLDDVLLMNCFADGNYSRFGERQGNHNATIGVIAHELGHAVFNTPDLYDTDNTSKGIGYFGLMGSGAWSRKPGDFYPGQTPTHPIGWTKIKMNFIKPSVISKTGDYFAIDFKQNNYKVFKINTTTNNEYFLIENRAPLGYDLGLNSLKNSYNNYLGGMLITHINDNAANNATDTKRLVDVEEANDPVLDSKSNNYKGSVNNLFYNGNSSTFNDTNNTTNSRKNDGASSGISITNIGDRGNSIKFRATIN